MVPNENLQKSYSKADNIYYRGITGVSSTHVLARLTKSTTEVSNTRGFARMPGVLQKYLARMTQFTTGVPQRYLFI